MAVLAAYVWFGWRAWCECRVMVTVARTNFLCSAVCWQDNIELFTSQFAAALTRNVSVALETQLAPRLSFGLKDALDSSLHHSLKHILGNSVGVAVSHTVPALLGRLLPKHLFQALDSVLTHTLTRSLTHTIAPAIIDTVSAQQHQHQRREKPPEECRRHCGALGGHHLAACLLRCGQHATAQHLHAAGRLRAGQQYYGTYFASYYSDYYADYFAKRKENVPLGGGDGA